MIWILLLSFGIGTVIYSHGSILITAAGFGLFGYALDSYIKSQIQASQEDLA